MEEVLPGHSHAFEDIVSVLPTWETAAQWTFNALWCPIAPWVQWSKASWRPQRVKNLDTVTIMYVLCLLWLIDSDKSENMFNLLILYCKM